MRSIISSPIKINLLLRVLSKKENGYHEIYSVFWQKTAIEVLTIEPKCVEIISDHLNVAGMEIKGENLITKVLSTARKYNKNIPPLEITLEKFFPTGSGIGAGSGNAGAMIRWLRDFYGAELPEEDTAKLGADVAFLASDNIMATARGIGEIMTPLKADLDLGWLLVFPRWRSNTKEAYAKLDERRGASFGAERDADIKDIEAERERYLGKLSRKERAGLLPNDFFSVLADEHAEYTTAQGIAAETGSLGWGLCGSGSAFFGLYDDEKKRRLAAERFNREQWVLKTYDLE